MFWTRLHPIVLPAVALLALASAIPAADTVILSEDGDVLPAETIDLGREAASAEIERLTPVWEAAHERLQRGEVVVRRFVGQCRNLNSAPSRSQIIQLLAELAELRPSPDFVEAGPNHCFTRFPQPASPNDMLAGPFGNWYRCRVRMISGHQQEARLSHDPEGRELSSSTRTPSGEVEYLGGSRFSQATISSGEPHLKMTSLSDLNYLPRFASATKVPEYTLLQLSDTRFRLRADSGLMDYDPDTGFVVFLRNGSNEAPMSETFQFRGPGETDAEVPQIRVDVRYFSPQDGEVVAREVCVTFREFFLTDTPLEPADFAVSVPDGTVVVSETGIPEDRRVVRVGGDVEDVSAFADSSEFGSHAFWSADREESPTRLGNPPAPATRSLSTVQRALIAANVALLAAFVFFAFLRRRKNRVNGDSNQGSGSA